MTGLERTLAFLRRESVDRPPFHPIIMRWAASQVFSGKSDPVTIIQDGTPEIIRKSVINDFRQARSHSIISAGCEITPGTSIDNMHAFRMAASCLHGLSG